MAKRFEDKENKTVQDRTAEFGSDFSAANESHAAPKVTYMHYEMDKEKNYPVLVDGDKFSISVLIDSVASCVGLLEGSKKQMFLNKVCSAYGISTDQQLNLEEIADQLKESPVLKETEQRYKTREGLDMKQPKQDFFDLKKESDGSNYDNESVVEEV